MSDGNDFQILDADHEIAIMYIRPMATSGDNVITVAEMADVVGQKSDDMSQRFAQSLREWAGGNADVNTASVGAEVS
jgi:hypothetical protein